MNPKTLFLFVVFVLLPSVSFAQRPRSIEEAIVSLKVLSPEKRLARVAEEVKKERRVIWYTTSSPTIIREVVTTFNRRYPLIEVKYYRAKARDVTEKILTEARGDVYSADLITTSASLLSPLIQAGLIGEYQSPAQEEIPRGFKGKLWTGVNISPRVLGWNTKLVSSSEVPRRWEDLLQPRWKGKIMMDAQSDEEIITLMVVWDKKRAREYFEKLGTQDIILRRGRTLVTQLLAAGEAPLAVTVLPNEVEGLRAKGAPIDWAPLDHVPAHVAFISMAKYSPHPYAAALFHDFLLSAEGQKDVAETGRTVTNPKMRSKIPRIDALKNDPRLFLFTPDSIKKEWVEDAFTILDGVLLKGKN
jgi:iron(III) transport system substrate-binding protein